MTAFFVVVSDLMEIVLIELSNKTCKVAMLEVFGEDGFGESFILQRISDTKIAASLLWLDRTSRTTKLPPSSPHRTTCE